MAKVNLNDVWDSMDSTNYRYFVEGVLKNPILKDFSFIDSQRLWLSYISKPAERTALLGNVGSGKTALLAMHLLRDSWLGKKCLVFRRYASDLLSTGNVIDLLAEWTADARETGIMNWNKNEHKFTWNNSKGRIEYRSAEHMIYVKKGLDSCLWLNIVKLIIWQNQTFMSVATYRRCMLI